MSEWRELPWLYPPPGFRAFDFVRSIATPFAGVETTVVGFTVPVGFDGTVKRISHNFTGGGFTQGSGDLVWRIRVNNQVVKNFGTLLTEFGSIQQPREIDGIVIRAGQTVTYSVVCSNAALIAGTYIVCCFAGYYWPKDQVSDFAAR